LLLTFCHVAQGLIFVVDSNDRERIEEAKEESVKFLEGLVDSLQLILTIFAAKQRLIFWYFVPLNSISFSSLWLAAALLI
jgi:hypothetical protein